MKKRVHDPRQFREEIRWLEDFPAGIMESSFGAAALNWSRCSRVAALGLLSSAEVCRKIRWYHESRLFRPLG